MDALETDIDTDIDMDMDMVIETHAEQDTDTDITGDIMEFTNHTNTLIDVITTESTNSKI
jgi:hypothetical protein